VTSPGVAQSLVCHRPSPPGARPGDGQVSKDEPSEAGSVPSKAVAMTTITVETLVTAPIESCFDLARDVEAHIASTAGSGERAVAGVTTGRLGHGDQVTWEARHLGLRWRLTSRITELDRPRRFIDQQVHGPFRSWWHEHRFESAGSATKMIDVVRYQLPLGPVGRLVGKLYLDRYLVDLIEQRAASLKMMAEEPESQNRDPW